MRTRRWTRGGLGLAAPDPDACCPGVWPWPHPELTAAQWTSNSSPKAIFAKRRWRRWRRFWRLAFRRRSRGRTYFKQLPHARLLARQPELVGQVGLDLRILRVGSEVVRVLGIIDLCVAPAQRGRGLATRLLQAAEATAADWGAEFLVLFADSPTLYQRNCYHSPDPAQFTWLGIEDRTSCGRLERDFSGTLWCKSVSGKVWPPGPIDLLGYLF